MRISTFLAHSSVSFQRIATTGQGILTGTLAKMASACHRYNRPIIKCYTGGVSATVCNVIDFRKPGLAFITAYHCPDFPMFTGIVIFVYQGPAPIGDLDKLAMAFAKSYECFAGLVANDPKILPRHAAVIGISDKHMLEWIMRVRCAKSSQTFLCVPLSAVSLVSKST